MRGKAPGPCRRTRLAHPERHRSGVTASARRRASLSVALAAAVAAGALPLGGCADLEGAGPPQQSGMATMGGGPGALGASSATAGPTGSGGASDRGGATGTSSAASDGPTVSSRPAGKPDWVAVYESPREASYGDQVVIYVDKANLQVQKLDRYTYYLARTREVRRTSSAPKIQEIAVLCEGAPNAPATSLRGEGSEDRNGNYSIRQAAAPLTSVDQFSTQKVRIDPNNPNTFVIRAICLLGTEKSG